MTLHTFLSAATLVLCLFAFMPYVWEIIRKNNPKRPQKVTWIIWATLDWITLASMYAKDSVNAQIVASALGATTVTILALLYGTSEWEPAEILCLAGAVLGLTLWAITRNANVGILVSLFCVLGGSIPTIIETWLNPASESRVAWGFFFLACIPAVLDIPKWTLEDAAQPLTFTFIETVMVMLLFVRPCFQPTGRTKKEGVDVGTNRIV